MDNVQMEGQKEGGCNKGRETEKWLVWLDLQKDGRKMGRWVKGRKEGREEEMKEEKKERRWGQRGSTTVGCLPYSQLTQDGQ